MNFGSQILIFYAVGFFALLNNSCKSDRTIALQNDNAICGYM